MATAQDKDKALSTVMGQIEKSYGKGAVMRLGDDVRPPIEVIPTGSISLDVALGIGGLPRGRIVEIYGPESSGKCLTADTYVWSDRGLETIAELFERTGQRASCTTRVTDVGGLGLRVVNERGELETVAATTHNDRRPVLRIRLGSGRTVSATHNHPLRVLDQQGAVVWRAAGRLAVGDTVVSALFGAEEAALGDGIGQDEAVLLGYLVARGTLDGQGCPVVRLSGRDPEAAAELAELVQAVLSTAGSGAGAGHGTDSAHGVDDGLGAGGGHIVLDPALHRRLADDYGLAFVDAPEQSVPRQVRTAGAKAQRAFLSALFEADGWVDPASAVGLDVASLRLAEQVQLMLYGLGVPATLQTYPDRTPERGRHRVLVDSGDVPRFLQVVGFRSARRAAQVEAAAGPATPRVDLVASSREPGPGGPSQAQRHTHEQVVAIDDGGEQPTFDIVVPGSHSFLANGMLSHNTTVALHAVANAQRAGGIAAFIDAEHALDPEYAKNLGVDTDGLLVSQPDTGEQALEIADMLIRSGALDIIVIDSVAALVPRAEIEGEMGDNHVGLQARLMSQALRKLTGALNSTGTTAIFINQLREKIGVMFGSPETTTGGKALKFYASVRLDVRRIETLKDGTEPVGNRTRVKVVKNKVSPPFKQAEFDILYGQGISREGGLIDMGVEHGFIRKAGAWYTYEGDQLGQGKENARGFLRDNPDLADEIEKKVKEKLGVGPRIDQPAAGADVPVEF